MKKKNKQKNNKKTGTPVTIKHFMDVIPSVTIIFFLNRFCYGMWLPIFDKVKYTYSW